MKFNLPELPYPENALEPEISQKTISFHYGKHLQTYIDNTNKLLEGTDFTDESLENIIKKAQGGLYNNAAQAWNHEFYFVQFSAEKGMHPEGKLSDKINEKWGSFEEFKEKFVQEGVSQFGSGWVWLVKNHKNELDIIKTPNAGNPLTIDDCKPLLCFDVWEHAYYLDYQNRRADYVDAMWQLFDWDVIEKRMQ